MAIITPALAKRFTDRPAGPGWTCAHKDKLSLVDSTSAPLGIDESAMCAKFVLSTDEADRVGDIVVPLGIDITNFRRNPISLFNHDPMQPVGKWRDPKGECTIRISDHQATGTLYYSQKTALGEQIFALTVEGILSAISIGFNPKTEPEPRNHPGPNSLITGYRFSEIDLLEASVVSIPAHPKATLVRGVLSRNRLAGAAILAPIRKSLEALAEPAPAWSNGATLKGDFSEGDHPRDDSGKFGSGGGGGGENKPATGGAADSGDTGKIPESVRTMTDGESKARSDLAAYLKSPEYKDDQLRGKGEKKAQSLRDEVYKHLSERLAPLVETAIKQPPHASQAAGSKHVRSCETGTYVVTAGNKQIGIVVEVNAAATTSGGKPTREKAIRWMKTGKTNALYQMGDILKTVHTLGFNEKETVKPGSEGKKMSKKWGKGKPNKPKLALPTVKAKPAQAKAKPSLEECVTKKAGKLIDDGMPHAEAIAAAFTECAGDKAMGESSGTAGGYTVNGDNDDEENKALTAAIISLTERVDKAATAARKRKKLPPPPGTPDAELPGDEAGDQQEQPPPPQPQQPPVQPKGDPREVLTQLVDALTAYLDLTTAKPEAPMEEDEDEEEEEDDEEDNDNQDIEDEGTEADQTTGDERYQFRTATPKRQKAAKGEDEDLMNTKRCKSVCKAAAKHLKEMGDMEDDAPIKSMHKAASHYHRKELEGLVKDMGDDGEDETVAESEDDGGESDAPAAPVNKRGQKAMVEEESIDLQQILKALRPVEERVVAVGNAWANLNGTMP